MRFSVSPSRTAVRNTSSMPDDPAPSPPTAARFDWNGLGQGKAGKRFLDGYPSDIRMFSSPVDKLHDVLVALLASTQKSIVLNMFGYDDDVVNDIVLTSSKTSTCSCR